MTLSEDSEGHEHLLGALCHCSLCEKPCRLLQRQNLSPHLKFWSTNSHTCVLAMASTDHWQPSCGAA